MDKNTDFKLLGMTFTAVCDRKIPDNNNYYLSPGGYELQNGKQFDFSLSRGYIDENDRTKVHFEVEELDEDYSDTLTRADLNENFKEFYIFTGEDDEPEIAIKDVQNVAFSVYNNGKYGTVCTTQQQIQSIKNCIEESYQDFLKHRQAVELFGHFGHFCEIERDVINGEEYCLMESMETPEANYVVTDTRHNVVAEDITKEQKIKWQDITAECLEELGQEEQENKEEEFDFD